MKKTNVLGYVVIIPLNDKMPVFKQPVCDAKAFDNIVLTWYLEDYGCFYHFAGIKTDMTSASYIDDACNNRATAINETQYKGLGLYNYTYHLAKYITSLDEMMCFKAERWKLDDKQSVEFYQEEGNELKYYKSGLYTAEEADEIIRKINEMGKNGK